MPCTFSDAAVEKHSPCKPDGAGEVESVLLRCVSAWEPVAAEGAEAVEKVEGQGDHVHRHHHQDPQRFLERLEERRQGRAFRVLSTK